ncbi:hypothetical protein DYB32_008494 [Aphanomyces invadans]|uniref:Tyrosinase copper-binding domain-containing protein n=1 Tax=Aphanomyces invadans TaxID=157072 RepID=A0A3R6VRZ5_9STRA|nr:hypothetical protein DYB32_008494 [Aphanomyces invadans]
MAYLTRRTSYLALLVLAFVAEPALQQATCSSIAVDVDYPGNDIAGVAAAAVDNCCGICAATAHCNAFSYAYGTCYLKSANGSAIAKRGVYSATLATPPPCPAIENDTDYAGGDLTSVAASAAEACCGICKATAGCKLFAYAYGTCYLKHTQGPRTSKPGVRSSVVVPPHPEECPAIENDIDYPGGDLVGVAAAAADDCCGICKATAGCKLYSYAYGTCYLKHTQGSRTTKAGVRSGVVVPAVDPPTTTAPPTGQCSSSIANVDYYGMDIATVPGSSVAQCCDACTATSSCHAYVFYQGNCYLKSGKGRSSVLPGAAASALSSFFPTCAAIEDNVDYPGGDLTAVAKTTAEECCDECRSTAGCALFTWSWGTCYLKSTKGARRVSAGARSMLVSTAVTTPAATTTKPTIAPTTPGPTTSQPTATPTPAPTPLTTLSSCGKRQRKAWSASTAAEKALFISAVEESMKRGLFKRFLSVHNDLKANKEAHGTCVFLFWHRKFILAFEDMLRSLGPAYRCLTLAYWDYTQDYVQFQSNQCKTIGECAVATADLGGSTQGRDAQPADAGHTSLCVSSRPLNASDAGCVRRGDWHATTMPDWSISNARSSLFDMGASIAAVSADLELGIHGSVHMELRGAMGNGFLSPMDPIFYLHHAMVDVLHTVFYHCKVEPLNLDAAGQQAHESSFQGCTVNYGDGSLPVGPTTSIMMRSHVDLDDQMPIPVEDDPWIGPFFKPLPSEYYKLTDARTLGYSYNLVGLVGDLYTKCGAATATSIESTRHFEQDHTVVAPFKPANVKTLQFEDAIVSTAVEQGLTREAAFVELKKINLLLHVNCFAGGDIQDYPDDFKHRMHVGDAKKPGFVLWHQLQTNQTTVHIAGWQNITRAYYNCTGAMNARQMHDAIK